MAAVMEARSALPMVSVVSFPFGSRKLGVEKSWLYVPDSGKGSSATVQGWQMFLLEKKYRS